ncbi:VCBS repeat-containing protein [bacterium]|nr:VCBS repeat-containing protein [candidate division CSSED10-310 bacterium]
MKSRAKLFVFSFVFLPFYLAGSGTGANTNWTDQASPIFYEEWSSVALADFNLDGIIDVVGANPDATEPYSPASGLPVWLGYAEQSGNSYNWSLSSISGITGYTPSVPYPDPADPPASLPHIWRVLCGNPGNMMAEWDIVCIDDANVYNTYTVSGIHTYKAVKVGTWPDYYHFKKLEWTFTYNQSVSGFAVSCNYYGAQQNSYMYLNMTYTSPRGEISLLCSIEGGGSPAPGDIFVVVTIPPTFEVMADYHGTGGEYTKLFNDVPYEPLELGEYMDDGLYRYAIEIDPGQKGTPRVRSGDKWHFHSPGGPRTDSAYLAVDTADFNRDGQIDIIGCGPEGIDVFLQAGPVMSNIGFKVGQHNRTAAQGWNPGIMTINLNANWPTAINTEVWTFTYDDGNIWNVMGEVSGSQPPFDQANPGGWLGTWCGELYGCMISGSYYRGDQFTLTTFRNTWSADEGPADVGACQMFDLGDINHDGTTDIVAALGSGFKVYYNMEADDDGSGTIQISWVEGAGPEFTEFANDFAIMDINRDGKLDIVACSEVTGVHAWLGMDDGAWSADFGPEGETGFESLVLGDYNKDGRIDVAATSVNRGISIFYLRDDGTWFHRAKASIPDPDRENTGNGSMSAVKVSNSATKTEKWTIRCIGEAADGGMFSVFGDVSQMQTRTATVGELYTSDNGEVEFTIFDGPEDYDLEDFFTFLTGRGPLYNSHFSNIDTADLDNDGNLDLFASNDEDKGLRIWRGNGIYGWTAETSPQESSSWNAILGSTDFNFDGNPDVIAASKAFDGIHVWKGDDVDKFTWTGWNYTPISAGLFARVTHGDFNVDGKLDIAAANIEEDKDGIWVWEGDNLGGFINRNGPQDAQSGFFAIAVADFNIDGRSDIAGGHKTSGMGVWLAGANWEWSTNMSDITTGSYWDLYPADINRDGYVDLVAAKNTEGPEKPGVIIYLNDRNGGFSKDNVILVNNTDFNYWGVEAADINIDGYLDIVSTRKVGNPGIHTHWADPGGPMGVEYVHSYAYVDPSGWDHYYGISTIDFNLDAKIDYVAGEDGHGAAVGFSHGSRSVYCVYNHGWFTNGKIRDIATEDMTNNGTPDVVLATEGAGVLAYSTTLNSAGTVSFSTMSAPATDGDYIGVDIADFNRDGLPDIIAGSEGSGASGLDLWISNRDFSMLKITTVYPANGGKFRIQQDESITVTFNKPVDSATITYENILLKKGQILVPYSLFALSNNQKVRIDPLQMERDTEYTVILRGGSEGLRDNYSNQFDGNNDGKPQESPTDDYIFSFTTIDEVPPSVPTGLNVQAIDHGYILQWASNSDPILDTDLYGYWVCWNREYGVDYQEILYSKEALGDPPVITVRGLDNSEQVNVSVVSQDFTGNYSDYAEWLQVTPLNTKPEIWWAGMYRTDLHQAAGGNLTILAFVVDQQGDTRQVELYYYGTPLGVFLYDDGMHGDFSAGDGLYALKLPIGPGDLPKGKYLIELVATDTAGHKSFSWPYLHVLDDRPGESIPDTFMRFAEAEAMKFRVETEWGLPPYTAPGPNRPRILAAGYQMYPAADYEFGPHHCITAIVTDDDGYEDILNVELCVSGIPTGMYFQDNGNVEDYGIGDCLFGLDLSMPGQYNAPEGTGYLPPYPLLLQIRATDRSGNVSDLWPYIVSN